MMLITEIELETIGRSPGQRGRDEEPVEENKILERIAILVGEIQPVE
ncbi:MAG: hypothetical protein ACREYE_23685 [Gammaproteobacteria bacterium]